MSTNFVIQFLLFFAQFSWWFYLCLVFHLPFLPVVFTSLLTCLFVWFGAEQIICNCINYHVISIDYAYGIKISYFSTIFRWNDVQIGLDLIELKDICILCNFFLVWITQLLFNRLPTSFCFEWKTHEKHTSFITIQFLCFFSLWFFYCSSKECGCLLSLFVPFFHQSHCNLLFTAKFDTRKYHIFMSHFTYTLPSILYYICYVFSGINHKIAFVWRTFTFFLHNFDDFSWLFFSAHSNDADHLNPKRWCNYAIFLAMLWHTSVLTAEISNNFKLPSVLSQHCYYSSIAVLTAG